MRGGGEIGPDGMWQADPVEAKPRKLLGACIEYVGTRNADGYGVLPTPVHGSRLAHRAALADALGRPVDGLALHRCDNPPCINPAHLYEGTQQDNVADAVARGRARGGRHDQTDCVHGHELTPDNVHLKPNPKCRSGYERACRACRTARSRAQAAARKAARAARQSTTNKEK